MPTYVYKFVDTGETIEVQQGFHDDTLTQLAHPDSGEVLPVKKVFTPVGVTFKGSGFFKTDNRGKKTAAANASGSAESAKSDSKSSDSTSSESSSRSSDTSSNAGSKAGSTSETPSKTGSTPSSTTASTA